MNRFYFVALRKIGIRNMRCLRGHTNRLRVDFREPFYYSLRRF